MSTLTPAIRSFLEEPRFAVLATVNPDGSPQQTVMWYLLEGDTIMMNTARGRRKDRNLLNDGRISICVEDGYRYVTISGQGELVETPDIAQADIRRLAVRYHGEAEADRMVVEGFATQERITIRLKIASLDAHGFEESAS
jgi:PPOX class probable F420-dependent enzyme